MKWDFSIIKYRIFIYFYISQHQNVCRKYECKLKLERNVNNILPVRNIN